LERKSWSASLGAQVPQVLRLPHGHICEGRRYSMSSDKAQLVRYIRDMAHELAKMADRSSLDLLAYLLSLVVLEAETLNASEPAASADNPREG
jgi:hypothetical protein